VARVAGLLHLAHYAHEQSPWELPIDIETIASAILIGDYLIPHAKAAFAEMGVDPVIERARWILSWLERTGHKRFTLRDSFEGLKGRFKRVDVMAEPMELLENHIYIRQVPKTGRAGAGRPRSPEYEVNPSWNSQKSHNPQIALTRADFANSANSANTVHSSDEPPAGDSSVAEDFVEGVL